MPTARSGLSSAVVNGILYTIGGYTNASAVTASAANEAYNPSTNSWTEESGMPTANGYGSATSVNGVVYFTGGFTSSTANEAFTTPSLYYLLSKN
jgi:N-acetylneuraminic acid mutarotase